MLRSLSNFEISIFIVIGAFALVRVFYHFKFKRNDVSEFDRAVWRLKVTCLFFAVLSLVCISFLPASYYEIIDIKTSQDVVVGQLVRIQTKMAEDMRHYREILHFLGFLLAFHLIDVANFIGKTQSEKRKTEVASKPLGL